MKNISIEKINFYFIALIPLFILTGSLLTNTFIVLICLLFIYEQIKKKNFKIFNDNNFKFLLVIYFYFIINSIFIAKSDISFYKALAYIRFIFFAYALNYYFNIYRIKILNVWAIIFFITTFDIIFEYFFGTNILGFSSTYPARIASFTGDELIIGSFYFCFIAFILGFLRIKKNRFFYIFLIFFFFISLIIGERSSFLKIFIVYSLLLITLNNFSKVKKILSLVLIIGISIFFILQNDGLRSKYIKHIFKVEESVNQNYVNNKNKIDSYINYNRHLRHYFVALEIFKESPFFGSGFRTYRYESFKDKYNKNFASSAGSTHPHQIHFEFLSDLGIVGYSLILLNIIKLLLDQRKLKLNVFRYGSILFIISYMIPLIPSGSFFSTFYATIFWINYSFLIRNKN